MNYYFDGLQKYAVFSGRERRKAYWLFVLVNVIISIVLGITDKVAGLPDVILSYGPFYCFYALVVLIPSLAILTRRLHDSERSACWLFLYLIPCAGPIVLIVFACLPGTQGENAYGSDPLAQ